MNNQGGSELTRIRNATRFSWMGLKAAYANEAAFRTEIRLALLLVPVGLFLGNGGAEKALLVSVVLLVLIVELLNSAVESVVDRVGDEIHELSGRVKDIGSAAVFVALAIVILVWCVVLFF